MNNAMWCKHSQEANLLNALPEPLKLQVRRSQVRQHMEKIIFLRELERESLEKAF